jgi:hypothetical protein
MPTIIQLTPDSFNSGFQGTTGVDPTASNARNPGFVNSSQTQGRFDQVRRPVRGLQIKDDTYATIQVRTADGRNLPLIDAGGNIQSKNDSLYSYSANYSNFLLQTVQEQRTEKKQIVETFGEPYIFFFGEHPRIISASGVLLNTEDFNWRAEFLENYELYLRGTRCVQNKTRVYLSWDDIVTEGYIMDCQVQDIAIERYYVQFSFTMFLTNYQNVSDIGLSDFPRPTEFQLDVNSFDTTGFGIGFGVSRDLATERLINAATFAKNSLLDTIRSSIINADTMLNQVAQTAENLFLGRAIRVPAGLAPDPLDTQVAFGSIGLVSPIDGRVVTVPPQGDRWAASVFGPIQQNLDEYIARLPAWGSNTQPIVSDLFDEQTVKKNSVTDIIQQAFETFGIQDPPPVDIIKAAKNITSSTVPMFSNTAAITKGLNTGASSRFGIP